MNVDCALGSLQSTLDIVARGDTIFVTGTCNENILAKNEKQRIALFGGGTAVLNGASSASPTLNIRGKGILIKGFTITGGSNGIEVNRGSTAVIDGNAIQNTTGNGVVVYQVAFASITGNTIQDNPGAGIVVNEGSTARIGFNSDSDVAAIPNFIQNNDSGGIVVASSSSARIVGNTISGNGDDGILIVRDSHADISNNVIAANAGDAIEIAENSAANLGEDTGVTIFDLPNTTNVNNGGYGVRCVDGGVADGRLGTLIGTTGRSYSSRDKKNGPLGFGWTHSFNHYLVFNDDNADGQKQDPGVDNDGTTSSVSWFDGTGSEKSIGVNGNKSGVPIGATFTKPQGFFFQTTRNGDGTYSIKEKNGLTYTFESVAGTIGQRAKLSSIKDRNGNTLSLAYTNGLLWTVTDGMARTLTFSYDGSGRIIEVQDWTGRKHQYGYDILGNLASYKNPLAVANLQNPVTYTYYHDTSNHHVNHSMQSYTLPRGNGMTFEYYVNGKVFRHYNTLKETVTFSYNEFRRESVSVNERGHKRQFFFDKFGNPIKIIEQRGGTHIYTYDTNNPMNRISKRDPMGNVTQYAYDANGNVTTVTNPSGSTIVYSHFDALFNQPAKIKDPRGNYTLLKYDGRGNLLQAIKLKSGVGAGINDPANYVPGAAEVVAWTINTYDDPATGYGNLVSSKQVRDFATLAGPTMTYSYDAQNLNVTSLTRCGDKDGVLSTVECDTSPTMTYDTLGRATLSLRPDWYAVAANYDSVDRVIQSTDAFGNLRDYQFDANGNLIQNRLVINGYPIDQANFGYDLSDRRTTLTDAGGFSTAYKYDAAGNQIGVTDPDGNSLSFEYDPNNKVIAALDQEGRRVAKTVDLDGKPRTVTDPNGNVVTYEYYGPEKEGRLKSQKDGIGRITQYDYDGNGNVTSVTDNLGRTALTTHDELNRPARIVGPAYTDTVLGLVRPVTKNTFDSLGRLTQVAAGRTDSSGTNPNNDVVTVQMTYQFDDFGRKIKETDALGRNWLIQYDVNNNPVTITDAKGQTTQMTYGYGHQPLSRNANGSLTTYTRNPLSQVTRVETPDVTYEYGYDLAHRLQTFTDRRGNKILEYTYSPAGRLMAMEDIDGNRTDYEYDPTGRLTNIWAPNHESVAFMYDNGGRLVEK